MIPYAQFIQKVPVKEIAYQAARQARLRIPRKGEPHWMSDYYTGRGFVRVAKIRGYIKVDMPVELLEVQECDIAPERMARLENIGGTNDPIWVTIDSLDAGKPIYRVDDGNNRVKYARIKGRLLIPAFVTAYEEDGYRNLYAELSKYQLLAVS